MKLRVKIALCVLLMIFAGLSLLAVLTNLGVLPEVAPTSAEAVYELRPWEGFVAVFSPPGAETPTTMTDIRVQDLPLADRLTLAGGLGVADYNEVIRLLEDFGS